MLFFNSYRFDTEAPVEFDPLAESPILAFDADSGVFKSGGVTPGFLEGVEVWENLGSAGDFSGVGTAQPAYLDHGAENYLYLPGTTSNHAQFTSHTGISLNASSWKMTLRAILLSNNSHLFSSVGASTGRIAVQTGAARIIAGNRTVTLSRDVTLNTEITLVVEYAAGILSVTENGETLYSGAQASPVATGMNGIGAKWGGSSTIQAIRGKVFEFEFINGGVTELAVDFTAVPHGATSFVCSSGQTIDISTSTSTTDRSLMVGRPVIKFDGSTDVLNGVFSPSLTGGRLFAVFKAVGGNNNSSRAFSTVGAGADSDNDAAIWFARAGGNQHRTYVKGSGSAVDLIHSTDYTNRVLREVLIDGANVTSIVNGTLLSGTVTPALNSTTFLLGGSTGLFTAMDFEALYLFPVTMTSGKAQQMREYLNTRHNLGLTL